MRSVALHALGNILQRLAGSRVSAFLYREVAYGHDADQAVVVVHHGQAADLVLGHELRDLGRGHAGIGADHVVAGDVLHRAVEVPVSHGADHDVPVGDHADDATILHHRHRARVLVAHDARRHLDVV